MNDRARMVVWTLACVLWGLGASWAGRTGAGLEAQAERLRARRGQLDELARMEAQVLRARAALEAVTAAAADAGVAGDGEIETRLRAALGGLPGDIRQSVAPLTPGLRLRRCELMLESAPFERVAALAAILERERPAWRVVALDLRASVPSHGTGRALLVITRVERDA